MRQERPRLIRSIPPLGSIPPAIRSRVITQTGRIQRQPWEESPNVNWREIVKKHVYHGLRREKPRKPRFYEDERGIRWQVEVVEDYNARGDLGLILRFTGIDLTPASFRKGRHNYGPETAVFYSPIGYQNKGAFLVLSTYGDVFESQVVAVKKDQNPFFQDELYLPQLATTYAPTSMTVWERNDLVVVGYGQRG